MPEHKNILYEKQRKGVLITLNRPERLNAISPDLEREFHEALDEAVADPEVRAIVVTGAGRAFSSGYDLSNEAEFAWPYALPVGTSVAAHLDHWRTSDRANMNKFLHMWELSKPVIAAVNGWCMGGGSWYAVASHMTYASTEAVFAQPEVRHMDNSSFFWILAAGYKNALRYSLTGDHIDAQEALRIGIVNKVVAPDQLLDEAFRVVERIALVSPETVKINLAVATMGLEMMGLHSALTLNAELSAAAHTSVSEAGRRRFVEAQKLGGLRGYLQERDGPFQPEPFGPRSRPRT
ncbi:MAG: enoyl-CoA hydratase/isomerase family protein [Chloroflexi bacterium]|nr:enoyl-CoA hydratase/isomerase family protein [Chloroflexota bacterium]